jgi:tetratricopeptide (TPR) repeat protein
MIKYKIIILLVAGCLWLLAYSPLRAQQAEKAAYDRAIGYLNKGNTRKGFSYLDRALSLNPSYYDALYARAYYNLQEGRYSQAITDYTTILTTHPDDTTVYRYRGLAHVSAENFAAAEADLLTALSMDSTNSSILGELGYLYFQADELDLAKQYFRESVRYQPNTYAYYNLAQSHYADGEFTEALEALEKNLGLEAKDEEALRLKALVFLNTKKYPEAIAIYEQLLASGSIDDPDDLINWGLVYYAQKKYPQALTYFKTAKNDADAELQYFIGLTHFRLKDTRSALKAFNRSVKLLTVNQEENAPIFYDRAIVRMAAKDTKGAVADFFQSVYLMPEIIRQQNAAGDTLELLGNASALLRPYYSPRQLDSVSALGYRERARLEMNALNGEDAALASINESLRLRNNDAESYYLRSRVHYLRENYSEALKDITSALDLSRNAANEAYLHQRGLIYYENQDFDKAHQDLSRAIALNGANAVYYYDRAYASAGRNDWDAAIADITQALTLDPDDAATYLLARAGFYLEQNHFAKALADCDAAIRTTGQDALAYYQRGLAYQGLRQYREAVTDFTRALQLESDFPEANEALQEALLQVK